MPREDTVDFIAAFVVGTVLGVGATLLLQPERTPKERVIRQLKPYRRQMRRSLEKTRQGLREGADATGELGGEVISAGRELIGEFRSEVAKILGEARGELREMVEDQLKDLSPATRRSRRRFGV